MKDKLIIFDMDNTLLQSRIDFVLMKQVVYETLDQLGLPQYKHRSVAHTMQIYMASPEYDPVLVAELWERIAAIEEAGMEQAVMEDGAIEALAYLHEFAELAVLTNNTDKNLGYHLGRLGILPYLSCVAGRDMVKELKPAPEGMRYVMNRYPSISPRHTVTVGDAWNDATAAKATGIGFVSYNKSRPEKWDALGIQPLLRLTVWNEAACRALLHVME